MKRMLLMVVGVAVLCAIAYIGFIVAANIGIDITIPKL